MKRLYEFSLYKTDTVKEKSESTNDKGEKVITEKDVEKKVEHKYLKKARYVHVVGTSSQTRPKTKSRSDASKSSFKSRRVIILDARAAKAFPLLFD